MNSHFWYITLGIFLQLVAAITAWLILFDGPRARLIAHFRRVHIRSLANFRRRKFWAATGIVKPATGLKVVCAWCKQFQSGDFDATITSHTICPKCADTFTLTHKRGPHHARSSTGILPVCTAGVPPATPTQPAETI